MTAAPAMQAILILLATSLVGLATLLSALAPSRHRYGTVFILTAPFVALAHSAGYGLRAIVDGFGSVGAVRRHPALRGALLAIPVALVFAALFAGADPVFASGRDALSSFFGSVEVLPRLVMFAAVTFIALGAYAFAASESARSAEQARETQRSEARSTDRLEQPAGVEPVEYVAMVAAAAAVSWLFVLLQLAYAVTAIPVGPGSGVSYAEYAHRGFGELSVAATIAVLLIVATLGRASAARASRGLHWAAFALLTAVAGILVSAFHRVTLYEDAYGFTTARVHAQAYMLVVFAVLVQCALEATRSFDTARLARRTMIVALVAIATLAFWNDEAWVVHADVDRFAGTDRFDPSYLVRRLSPDAYPALLEELPRLPQPERDTTARLLARTAACRLHDGNRWFEWNLGRARARAALRAQGYALEPPPPGSCASAD